MPELYDLAAARKRRKARPKAEITRPPDESSFPVLVEQAEPGVFDPRSWAPELVDYLFGDKLSFSDVPIGGSYEEQVAFQNALAEQWASDVLDVAKYTGGLTGSVAGLVGDFRNTTGLWSDYFGGTGDLFPALASSAGTIQRAEDIIYPPLTADKIIYRQDDDVEPTIKIGDRVWLDDGSAIVTKIDGDRIFVDVEDGPAPNILEIPKSRVTQLPAPSGNPKNDLFVYETPLSRMRLIPNYHDMLDDVDSSDSDFKTLDDLSPFVEVPQVLMTEWTNEPDWEEWEDKYFDYIDSWGQLGPHGIFDKLTKRNRKYLHYDIMQNIYDLTMKTAKPGEEISTFKQIIETIAARQDAEPDESAPIIYKKVMNKLWGEV